MGHDFSRCRLTRDDRGDWAMPLILVGYMAWDEEPNSSINPTRRFVPPLGSFNFRLARSQVGATYMSMARYLTPSVLDFESTPHHHLFSVNFTWRKMHWKTCGLAWKANEKHTTEKGRAYFPCGPPTALNTESEIGVGRNCFWLSLASLVKVSNKLRARLWIFLISTLRGCRNSSSGVLFVAIGKAKHGDTDKIKIMYFILWSRYSTHNVSQATHD